MKLGRRIKKEASQLINAKSLGVTPKSGSADTSESSIPQPDDSVKENVQKI